MEAVLSRVQAASTSAFCVFCGTGRLAVWVGVGLCDDVAHGQSDDAGVGYPIALVASPGVRFLGAGVAGEGCP
jgi:hypothetical protein